MNIADMHTHSENSHDSICKIEDMVISQIKKGMHIFAVTDHADIDSYKDYDIFTPIQRTYETVKELRKKHNIRLLSGVEISEGIWHPEISAKMKSLCDYDVIIGSVHCVRYKNMTQAYSTIDFSKFYEDEINEFLDAYFNDLLEVTEFEDFDILAHLTCPLRYITGKYGFKIDLSMFDAVIEKILKNIIKRDIALEINTSSYAVLNDFMPTRDIIKKYKKMGGEIITLGSDAHTSENASQNFDTAVKFLKEISFNDLYYFEKRQAKKTVQTA